MRVCIIDLHFLFFILGLSCFQAYGQENSTRVYYAVLTIEQSVLLNVTNALSTFILERPTLKVKVSDMAVTTKCNVSEAGSLCSCLPKHVWSSEVCEKTGCCSSSTECSLPKVVKPICHPNTRVTIYGLIYLNNEPYYPDMADQNSAKFKKLSDDLIKKMKPVYSTLLGFDGMQITEFEEGVYASFEVYVNKKMSTKKLMQKTKAAAKELNATITVETEGLVEIDAPSQPVELHSLVDITCNMFEEGAWVQEWTHSGPKQATPKQVSPITNGTESIVTSEGAYTTKLKLQKTSGIWAGLITCTFKPHPGGMIAHRASVALDVALLPQIDIFSEPQFPRCKDDSTVVVVRVKCEIKKSTEHYTTTWIVVGNNSELVIGANFDKDSSSYDVNTAVGCLPKDENKPANMICVFSNRKNQIRNASIQINVIFKHSRFCSEVEDWPDTKANFSAKLRCEGRSGLRLRKCDPDGKWENEESQCVNRDLFSIAENTLVINKGLGSVSLNAENVFDRLRTATDDTESINTISNLNVSINILDNMQNLNTTFNELTLNNIVRSSSNILNIPLEDVWKLTRNAQSNVSMAELYLVSVEKLIRQTNISKQLSSEASNVQIQTCKDMGCRNKVFNVTVSVGGHEGIVKMAGFKNLVKFLPPIQQNADPNSIVVTVSVDGKQEPLIDRDVRIQFQLTSPRPRNHAMKCVAMDDLEGKWSLDRCTWGGPSNEGSCKCRFSSAFATILSRNAINLPALREITYVGLAFSIASLVLFLVIESLVWTTVVKTNSLFLRHVTLVNISLSLLVGDCSLLASTFPGHVSAYWCQVCVVLQHFFYLAQFCWMFCLSTLLLYQIVFVFSDLNKGKYQGLCYFTGYGAPFVIVTATFVSHNGGAEGSYYDAQSCWLTHHGMLKGSFYSFIIPVGIIVFVNLFSMALVIIKLLNHPKGGRGGGDSRSGSHTAIRILRSIVILTPVFGVTWLFGFATLALDLADGLAATAVYYIFSICNSFQGLFILLTACVGEKMVRDALMKRLSISHPPTSTKETFLTMQSDVRLTD